MGNERGLFEKGEKRYYVNVEKHLLICAACPDYKPKKSKK